MHGSLALLAPKLRGRLGESRIGRLHRLPPATWAIEVPESAPVPQKAPGWPSCEGGAIQAGHGPPRVGVGGCPAQDGSVLFYDAVALGDAAPRSLKADCVPLVDRSPPRNGLRPSRPDKGAHHREH